MRTIFVSNIAVETAPIYMYEKCGKLKLTHQFLDEMSQPDD
jgi:hypothetical protein